MIEDTLDMEEDEELEEEADAEVDKVLFTLTDGKLGLAGPVNTELLVSFLVYSCGCSTLDVHPSLQRMPWKTRRQNRWRSTGSNWTACLALSHC